MQSHRSTVGHGCPHCCDLSCSTFRLVRAIASPSLSLVHLSIRLSVCGTSWFSVSTSSGPGWCDFSFLGRVVFKRCESHLPPLCSSAWQLAVLLGESAAPMLCVAHLGDLFVEFFLLQRDAEKLPGLLESCSHLINVSFNASCE